MNYMKRLERLWNLQAKVSKELELHLASNDGKRDEHTEVLITKIIRLKNMTDRA